MTFDQIPESPFFNEGLGTEHDTVEQNFDPTHLANNDNKQLPILIHMQNSDDDPNDQIYNRCDLQDEPHSPMCAEFQTNNNSQSDSQSIKIDTHKQTTKAQIHAFPETTYSDRDNFDQNVDTEFQSDSLPSQYLNISLPENQIPASQHFRSHDNQQIVMANDKAFGALDFYHNDINLDADNELLQYLLLTPPNSHLTKPLLDVQMPNHKTTVKLFMTLL
jgi:hypothetical protein